MESRLSPISALSIACRYISFQKRKRKKNKKNLFLNCASIYYPSMLEVMAARKQASGTTLITVNLEPLSAVSIKHNNAEALRFFVCMFLSLVMNIHAGREVAVDRAEGY